MTMQVTRFSLIKSGFDVTSTFLIAARARKKSLQSPKFAKEKAADFENVHSIELFNFWKVRRRQI